MRAIVAGGGGHARSVIDVARSLGIDITGIVDPDVSLTYGSIPVVGQDDDLPMLLGTIAEAALLGVGYLGGGGGPRPRLFNDLSAFGYELPAIIDASAAIAQDATIGEATFVGKHAVVNAASSIGNATIINTHAVVEHDCIVDSFAHISVGAILCGGVSVGRGAFVGAGATVIQRVSIGENAIVGAGSVVLSDVPAGAKVMGVFHG